MQRIVFRVEWVDSEGFHLLAENVVLEFPDTVGTFPMPKPKVSERALEDQHPELFAKVPTFEINGFSFMRGLCFTRQEGT